VTDTPKATRKYTINSYEYVFTFGKYKGKTCDEVADKNPGYLVWLDENEVADINKEILEAAVIDDANNSPPEEYFWTPD